jgi:hypothetical protein
MPCASTGTCPQKQDVFEEPKKALLRRCSVLRHLEGGRRIFDRALGAVQVPLVNGYSARYNTPFFGGNLAISSLFFNEIRKGIR